MTPRVRVANLLRRIARRLDPPRFEAPAWLKEKWELRIEVFGRHAFACVDCGEAFPKHSDPYQGEGIENLTLGHIIPRSMGGRLEARNLVAQCLECNRLLGQRVWQPGWFIAVLEDRSGPVTVPDAQELRDAWLDDLQRSIAA